MAPKRKGGARKAAPAAAAAAADKLPAEKQDSAEETVPAADVDEDKAESEPSPKKTKVEEKKKRGRKPKAASKVAAGSAKKIADDDSKAEEEVAAEDEGADEVPGCDVAGKVIVIEASKECNCFKTRAATVQTGLTKAIPGIEVLINPEKPRKGCFEVRGKEGNIYLSLLGLPRPFTKLKNMDMAKAIEEIVAKVK